MSCTCSCMLNCSCTANVTAKPLQLGSTCRSNVDRSTDLINMYICTWSCPAAIKKLGLKQKLWQYHTVKNAVTAMQSGSAAATGHCCNYRLWWETAARLGCNCPTIFSGPSRSWRIRPTMYNNWTYTMTLSLKKDATRSLNFSINWSL